jgi:DNA-directed RNA polymerase specialized sigma24 family protein
MDFSDLNDPEFLEKLRAQGSHGQEAFAQLVRASHDRLMGFMQRRLSTETECILLLQEVYMQMHKDLPTFSGPTDLTTWMYSVTHQLICNRTSNMESLSARNSVEKLLVKAIESLASPTAQAYHLGDIEGLSTEATAQILGITVEEARMQIHGTRRKIVDWVQEKMLAVPESK